MVPESPGKDIKLIQLINSNFEKLINVEDYPIDEISIKRYRKKSSIVFNIHIIITLKYSLTIYSIINIHQINISIQTDGSYYENVNGLIPKIHAIVMMTMRKYYYMDNNSN